MVGHTAMLSVVVAGRRYLHIVSNSSSPLEAFSIAGFTHWQVCGSSASSLGFRALGSQWSPCGPLGSATSQCLIGMSYGPPAVKEIVLILGVRWLSDLCDCYTVGNHGGTKFTPSRS